LPEETVPRFWKLLLPWNRTTAPKIDLPHPKYPQQGLNTPPKQPEKPQGIPDVRTSQRTQNPDAAAIRQPDDPDLAAVVAAWPTLPDALKAAMLALAKAGGGQ